MQPESGRSPEPNGETLLPPALTLRHPLAEPGDGPAAPLAPFFAGTQDARSGGGEAAPAEMDPAAVEAASTEDVVYEDAFLEEAQYEETPEAQYGEAQYEEAQYGEALYEEARYGSAVLEEVQLEPAFLEDDAAFDVAGLPGDEDLAAEEDTLVLLEEIPAGGTADHRIAEEVADRLETLAGRLRQSGLAALDTSSGDAVNTVLAAVLSGYVAARSR